MTVIRLPAHSTVLIIGGKRAPLAELADRIPRSAAAPWDIQKPAASIARILDAQQDMPLVRVCMKGSHPKGRATVARMARVRGAKCICLRLPGSPVMDAEDEKIDAVYDVADPNDVTFEIVLMPSDRKDLHGPFDIVGDIHGVADELTELLDILGHIGPDGLPRHHPDGRIPILVGDLTDRGPQNRRTLEISRRLTELGGIVIRGNHDEKLRRWLLGKEVEVKAGLEVTIRELGDTDEAWRLDMAAWIGTLEPHVMLDGGRLAVAHAGIDEKNQGMHTDEAFSFALYGKLAKGVKTLDEDGFPMREDWAIDYKGDAVVVHGHIAYDEPRVLGNVVAVDTGCVHGGKLTAYQWPERTFVSVDARRNYFPADEVS